MKLKFINIFIFSLLLSACTTNDILKDSGSLDSNSVSKNISVSQTNNNLNFSTFLSGVNAVVVITDEQLETVFDNDDEFYRRYQNMIKEYLSGIGFEQIAVTTNEQNLIEETIPYEQRAKFKITIDNVKSYIAKISMQFQSCNNDEFIFSNKVDFYVNNNWDNNVLQVLKNMYWQKQLFDSKNTLVLYRKQTKWNYNSLKKYIDENSIDQLEGIYEKYGGSESGSGSKYSLGIVKTRDGYDIVYLSGSNKTSGWREGELKGSIRQTSIRDFYKVSWTMLDRSISENVYLNTAEYNFLEFDFLDSDFGHKSKYIKMYPNFGKEFVSSDNYITSGTGFLISDKGYIVTNHHIIGDSKNFNIKFENKKNKHYEAKIIYDDRKNDLAILRLVNFEQNNQKNHSFEIRSEDIPKGSIVYTLGYPMIETMGQSVKLSSGIVSSEYGYMSNPTQYQLSVPINPGNSGGPLFDEYGNLVGIINAKYKGAENVTYAIKSKILVKILEDLKIIPFTKNAKLSISNLVEQVEKRDDLVCLIKVY